MDRANSSLISPPGQERIAEQSRRASDSADCLHQLQSDLLITSADTVFSCAVVMVAAAFARAVIATRFAPSSDIGDTWHFPALEGPILLAEFLGLAKALFDTMIFSCVLSRAGSLALLTVLALFLPISIFCILAHIRRGDARFYHLQSPSRDHLLSKSREMFPAKFGQYLSVMHHINERGVWQYESGASQRWNFMLHFYWGGCWTYTIW